MAGTTASRCKQLNMVGKVYVMGDKDRTNMYQCAMCGKWYHNTQHLFETSEYMSGAGGMMAKPPFSRVKVGNHTFPFVCEGCMHDCDGMGRSRLEQPVPITDMLKTGGKFTYVNLWVVYGCCDQKCGSLCPYTVELMMRRVK